MKRMSGADGLMLGMETSSTYMHTFKVAILDPSTDPDGWSFDKFLDDFKKRLHLVPFFRWRYAPIPLALNHPVWVEDPDFDLSYHVRRVGCPPPGDHRALCEFMSSVYAYQLDRNRPLWMLWVVEGLEQGKVALVTLVHHAYVDGIGAAWVLGQLYSGETIAADKSKGEWNPPKYPSWGRRFWWGLRDWPRVMIGNLPLMTVGLWRIASLKRQEKKAGSNCPNVNLMKKTPINRSLSPGRIFVCDNIPLSRLKQVSKGLGVTINDVFVSCTAGAVRKLLKDMDFDPDRHPLIAGTPFSGQRPEGMEGVGNFATVDFCWLHSEIEDPLERLQASHDAAEQMKEHLRRVREAKVDLNSMLQMIPPWGISLLRRWIHSSKGKIGFFGNLITSNVPGPTVPLYLGKYKLDSWYSTGQIFDGSCLNVTMWSYCDKANICILTDRKILADGWVLFEYFLEELEMLLEHLPESTPGQAENPSDEKSFPNSN